MRNSLTRRVAIVFTTAVWPRWQGSGRSQDQPRWRGCSSRTGRSCRRCHWPAGRPSRWTGPAPHTNRPAVGGCEICAPPCWAIAEDCTRQGATDVRTGPPATVWWKDGLMIPDGGGSADTETDGATPWRYRTTFTAQADSGRRGSFSIIAGRRLAERPPRHQSEEHRRRVRHQRHRRHPVVHSSVNAVPFPISRPT